AGDLSLWDDEGDSGSNFGDVVEISAPGSGVFSTVNDGKTSPNKHIYGYKGGTSMAAPHVTGVIALVLTLRPTLDTNQLLDLLQYTAQGFPQESTCSTGLCGAGILDANDAVRDIFLIKGSVNGLGLPSQPYGGLNEAYGAAWDGSNLKIRSDNFNGSYTFNKEMTLTAVGGTVTIGQP
ncbi:MAG: S8 family serine peptidase, partial [Chloroflexi bacterium]|nr:S8 family serine peptidase [Chloroflexota bacterium]